MLRVIIAIQGREGKEIKKLREVRASLSFVILISWGGFLTPKEEYQP